MGDAQERRARGSAERGRPGKLIARAEWEFGPLPRAEEDDEDPGSKVLKRLRAQNARTPRDPAKRRGGKCPALLSENLLAWDVLMAVYRGGQFLFQPMGGVVGFLYESVIKVIELKAPPDRRREVFEKFQWIEPYAIESLKAKRRTGGNDEDSDSAADGKGRRKRRHRSRG